MPCSFCELSRMRRSTRKSSANQRVDARSTQFLPPSARWTILIDKTPTAFRAREKEELLPTFQQLRRTNKDVVMKWFARGRLWESREEERDSWQRRKTPVGVTPERHGAKASASGGGAPRDEEKDKRGRDWRPGGQHKDPRDRFKRRLRPVPSEKGGVPLHSGSAQGHQRAHEEILGGTPEGESQLKEVTKMRAFGPWTFTMPRGHPNAAAALGTPATGDRLLAGCGRHGRASAPVPARFRSAARFRHLCSGLASPDRLPPARGTRSRRLA